MKNIKNYLSTIQIVHKVGHKMALILMFLLSHLLQAQEVIIDGYENDDDAYSQPQYPNPNQSQMQLVTYRGDGMTIVIQQYDENSGFASGTVTLGRNRPMAFRIRISTDERGLSRGNGQVQSQQGNKRISSWDESDMVTMVNFEGKQYRLFYQQQQTRNYQQPRSNQYQTPQAEIYREPPNPYNSPGNPSDYYPEKRVNPENTSDRKPTNNSASKPLKNLSLNNILLQKHLLKDPKMHNMVSHNILVPKGWKVEGGAWWPPTQAFLLMPSKKIKVLAPDGSMLLIEPLFQAKELKMPQQLGVNAPRDGSFHEGFMVFTRPKSVTDWAQFYANKGIPALFPNARNIRITKTNIIPGITQKFRQQAAEFAQALRSQSGPGMNIFADGMALSIEASYTDSGREWQHIIIFGTKYGGFGSPYIGRTTIWEVNNPVSMRVPKGKLSEYMPVFSAILNSLKVDPKWVSEVARGQAKIQKITVQVALDKIRGYSERSNIISQTGNDINQMIIAGGENRNRIREGSLNRVIHSINETRNYVNPNNQNTVTLPNQYERVFTNGNGDFILTNDRFYQPGSDQSINGSWSLMKAQN